MTLPTATELLEAWDALRPRSQQAELGMSELGGCARKAGYTLQGYPPGETEGGKIQAILGTAIHMALAEAGHALLENALAENMEVRFAGLLGHPDLYHEGTLCDWKTKGYSAQLDKIRRDGPPQGELWQISLYAAGMSVAGHPVRRVRLNYIARDSGDEYVWEDDFRIEHVRDAVAWLANCRSAPVEFLPRAYHPESAQCRSCPFRERCWAGGTPGRDPRSVFYAEDPNAAAWAGRLRDARERKAEAEADEERARAALDALRRVEQPGESEDIVVAPGLAVRFSVSRGASRLDADQVRADYARAGARPPMRTAKPVVKLSLVKPEESSG